MIRHIAIVLVVLLAAAAVNAATIRVPADQPTIQDAIDAATTGDVVLVAPGIYRENINYSGKNITVATEAGPWLTNLRPATTDEPIVTFHNNESLAAVLSGFTLSHTNPGPGIHVTESSPTITGNFFTNHASHIGNGSVIYVTGPGQCVIDRNVFWDNEGSYGVIWANSDQPMTVTNNTVHTGRVGLILWSDYSTAKNNTVTGCQMGVTAPREMIHQYNNIWGNNNDFISGAPDPTDISVDPEYIDEASSEFALSASSPLIDVGDPGVSYYDPDGTRNDIGALPFDHGAPNNLNLGYEDRAHVVGHTPTFYWMLYVASGTQTAYEVEVGTDNDWSVAELWSSGTVSSLDTMAVYAGVALEDGDICYWRLRLFSGSTWTSWAQGAFRMNVPPTTPVPVRPVGSALVSVDGVDLTVASSTSAFGDDLTYDYELYSDPGLTMLVDSRYGVSEEPGETGSGFFSGLTLEAEYWWRSQANDGHEASDWSAAASFVTRVPGVVHVPSEYPTIQAGLDAAMEHDTVMVADGTYTGDGNRDLDFGGANITLLSESGPEATIIDCQASEVDPHYAIHLHTAEDSTARVEGFTLTGAYVEDRGAVSLDSSSITLRNCAIADNLCDGVWTYPTWSEPRQYLNVYGCTISRNAGTGLSNLYYAGAIINSEISSNGEDGVYLYVPENVNVSKCLMRGNAESGLYINTGYSSEYTVAANTLVQNRYGLRYYYWPPKDGESGVGSKADSAQIRQNILAFNNEYGIYADGLGFFVETACNNTFGNTVADWEFWNEHDSVNDFFLDPLFCDTAAGDFSLASSSPCAPAGNDCGIFIGAFGVGCDCCVHRGDIDRSGGSGAVDIADLVYLVNFMFRGGPAPPCPEEADVDAVGGADIGDLVYLVNYMFQSGPPPVTCD